MVETVSTTCCFKEIFSKCFWWCGNKSVTATAEDDSDGVKVFNFHPIVTVSCCGSSGRAVDDADLSYPSNWSPSLKFSRNVSHSLTNLNVIEKENIAKGNIEENVKETSL